STIVQVRNQSTRLVLQKFVTGPMGDTTRDFSFTLSLRDDQGNPVTGSYGDLTFDAQGSAETALSDGGEVTLRGLPLGTLCTITEEAVPDYETTVQVDGGEPAAALETTVTLHEGLNTVSFTNRSTLTPPTPTPTPTTTPDPSARPHRCPLSVPAPRKHPAFPLRRILPKPPRRPPVRPTAPALRLPQSLLLRQSAHRAPPPPHRLPPPFLPPGIPSRLFRWQFSPSSAGLC
ncbi:MAG TPA: DUF5979 domain-containing protein, partial [Subdoligranulum variabile]|nr:DUF5979 domain-containing protein [Subdoligranulum variabile]